MESKHYAYTRSSSCLKFGDFYPLTDESDISLRSYFQTDMIEENSSFKLPTPETTYF